MDEFPLLKEILKNEEEIQNEKIEYYSEYIPYFEKLTSFVRVAVDIIRGIRDKNRWAFFLYDLLRRVEEAGVTSFSMFLKGYPNQALLCLRPSLEAVGYAWHIHLDISENLELWREYKIKKMKGEKIDKELNKKFKQVFNNPRFPKEIPPIGALKEAYAKCSELSAHIGIPGFLMYYAFDTGQGHHYMISIAGMIIETLRNIAAGIGEICTISFPTLPWQNLEKEILFETPNFLHRKMLDKMFQEIKVVIETKEKIFIKSDNTKAKIEFAILGLKDGPFALRLIERLKQEVWESEKVRKRAEKVIPIIMEIVKNRPSEKDEDYEGTESEFLKPIEDFLDYNKI